MELDLSVNELWDERFNIELHLQNLFARLNHLIVQPNNLAAQFESPKSELIQQYKNLRKYSNSEVPFKDIEIRCLFNLGNLYYDNARRLTYESFMFEDNRSELEKQSYQAFTKAECCYEAVSFLESESRKQLNFLEPDEVPFIYKAENYESKKSSKETDKRDYLDNSRVYLLRDYTESKKLFQEVSKIVDRYEDKLFLIASEYWLHKTNETIDATINETSNKTMVDTQLVEEVRKNNGLHKDQNHTMLESLKDTFYPAYMLLESNLKLHAQIESYDDERIELIINLPQYKAFVDRHCQFVHKIQVLSNHYNKITFNDFELQFRKTMILAPAGLYTLNNFTDSTLTNAETLLTYITDAFIEDNRDLLEAAAQYLTNIINQADRSTKPYMPTGKNGHFPEDLSVKLDPESDFGKTYPNLVNTITAAHPEILKFVLPYFEKIYGAYQRLESKELNKV